MLRQGFALSSLVASLWLGACREAAAPAPATPPPAPSAAATSADYRVTVQGRIHADLPEMSFTLVTDSGPQTASRLRVRSIEIRRGAEVQPWQRISGLDTETPRTEGAPELEVRDLNFDGYADIRLIERLPAGPDVPYLNWLYDPASGRFVESPALNAITAPQFDAAAREIRSDWRESATRYGTDIYALRDGQPVLVRRETKDYKRPGVYTRQVLRRVDGDWHVIETREGRDP
jgi:hypothetical protein